MTPADSYAKSREQAFHWLVITGAWVLYPLLLEHNLWVFFPFVLMSGWHAMMLHKGWRGPGRLLRIILTLAISFSIVWQHGSVLGQDTGVALLIAIYGLKFSELNRERDYHVQILNLMLLLLGNLLYDQSLWMVIHQGVAIIAILFILSLIHQGQGMADKRRLQYALTMMVVAIPLTLLMYVLFPRLPAALWGLTTNSDGGLTGFTEEIKPGGLARLSKSTQPVFRASFRDGFFPPQNELYWRGSVLSVTDGRRWFREKHLYYGEAGPVTGERSHTYEVIIEPHDKHWIFALDLPVKIDDRSYSDKAHIVRSRRAINERRTFTLTSIIDSRLGQPDTREQSLNLLLPENVSERVVALAKQWAATARDPEDLVGKALAYFNTEPFFYTLEPPLLGGNPVDEFLFETRRGYCEHYASAFVTLMRAAGLPARVVIGFQGGDYNAAGDYYLIRRADAHAWAEYLHPERGWTRADPTFAVAPARIEYGSDAWREAETLGLDLSRQTNVNLPALLGTGWLKRAGLLLQQRWDALNMVWYRWVTDFGPEQQQALLELLRLGNLGLLARILVLAASVLLLLALISSWFYRQQQKEDPVQKVYLKLCARLAGKGLSRHPHEGPAQYLLRLKQYRPEWSQALDVVFSTYTAIRYGPAGSSSGLKELRQLVRRLRLH